MRITADRRRRGVHPVRPRRPARGGTEARGCRRCARRHQSGSTALRPALPAGRPAPPGLPGARIARCRCWGRSLRGQGPGRPAGLAATHRAVPGRRPVPDTGTDRRTARRSPRSGQRSPGCCGAGCRGWAGRHVRPD